MRTRDTQRRKLYRAERVLKTYSIRYETMPKHREVCTPCVVVGLIAHCLMMADHQGEN